MVGKREKIEGVRGARKPDKEDIFFFYLRTAKVCDLYYITVNRCLLRSSLVQGEFFFNRKIRNILFVFIFFIRCLRCFLFHILGPIKHWVLRIVLKLNLKTKRIRLNLEENHKYSVIVFSAHLARTGKERN